MGKKKTVPPEETMTPEGKASEEGTSAMPAPPTETALEDEASSADEASTAEVEDESIPTEPSAEPLHDFDELKTDLSALQDRHLRLIAEFTNYRRRVKGELSEAWGRGQADLLRSFVDALDDLQRVGAWQADNTTVEALIEGVDLVERKFRQALEGAGVELFDPVGEVFDPHIMEAMLGVPTEDSEEDQKVQEVFQKGYRYKGQLVRPARVVVFKHG